MLLTQLLTRDRSRVRTHSLADAAVAPDEPAYPVVVLRAGLAALTASYTALAEDLRQPRLCRRRLRCALSDDAAGPVPPDGSVVERAPANDADLLDGAAQEELADKLVAAWSADVGFALDALERLDASDPAGRFRGRLDLQRVGVLGHSLGGATALRFCHDYARCKAGIDYGAPVGSPIREGVTQPFGSSSAITTASRPPRPVPSRRTSTPSTIDSQPTGDRC